MPLFFGLYFHDQERAWWIYDSEWRAAWDGSWLCCDYTTVDWVSLIESAVSGLW